MTAASSASFPPPDVSFTADDCELFARYANKVAWPSQVAPEDRDRFKAIRSSLNLLFQWLCVQYDGGTTLRWYASRVNPNAFSPQDLWACAYPFEVGQSR